MKIIPTSQAYLGGDRQPHTTSMPEKEMITLEHSENKGTVRVPAKIHGTLPGIFGLITMDEMKKTPADVVNAYNAAYDLVKVKKLD